MDYKNTNSIKIKKVIEVFSSILIKKYNIKFKYGFKNKIINKNAKKINNKIKSIDSNENSIIVMRKYFLNHIHEKNN